MEEDYILETLRRPFKAIYYRPYAGEENTKNNFAVGPKVPLTCRLIIALSSFRHLPLFHGGCQVNGPKVAKFLDR